MLNIRPRARHPGESGSGFRIDMSQKLHSNVCNSEETTALSDQIVLEKGREHGFPLRWIRRQ